MKTIPCDICTRTEFYWRILQEKPRNGTWTRQRLENINGVVTCGGCKANGYTKDTYWPKVADYERKDHPVI